MKRARKFLNIGFLLFFGLFFLAGLCKTVFFPKEDNLYENRPANRLSAPKPETVWDSSFQETVEKALSDQVLLAQTMKSVYNDGNSKSLLNAVSGFLESKPPYYVNLLGAKLFHGDYLVYGTYPMERVEKWHREKAENLNARFAAHPELDFYVYYIEKDTDINFETGEKPGIFPALKGYLTLPEDHIGCFEIDSFSEFQEKFYRTDHHWNHKGSYEGYLEVRKLLGVTEEALEPLEEVVVGKSFSGSKAGSSGMKGVVTEEFSAYRFAYPPMEITVKGQAVEDYGEQTAYLDGTAQTPVDYGSFYGWDWGEVVFDTGSSGRGNLLVLGESFDNAILKLLASHFDRTFSVDLRDYAKSYEVPFSFSEYVKKNQIDTVLLIGNCDFYTKPEFLLEE